MKVLLPKELFCSTNLNRGLAQKSLRGGMTTIGSQGVQFILSMVSTVVLARLLSPADYGLIGMVTVVVNFAVMFKDAGLSMATVQKEDISHEQISTLFWINVLISAGLGLCVLASSPLVAWFYGKPELSAVTAVLSISFILSGLTIQHQALQRRHMHFATLAGIQITAQVITIIVTIFLACVGWRYWALVGGTLAQALANSLLTFLFCPWIPGRMKRGTGVREMLKFGGNITGFNFVNYFSRNADNILIGKFIGANALGLYSRAYNLFMMPISQIRAPLDQVAMPVLSTLRNEPERYAKYYQRILDILASLTMPLTIYCAVEADFLIRVLLGPQWLGAVGVFRILAIAGMIQAIAGTRGMVLLSCGFSKRYFYLGIFYGVFCVASFVIGLPFGIIGVATAYTIFNYIALLPSLYYCFYNTPVKVSLFLKTIIPALGISGVAALVVILIKYTWKNESVFIHVIYIIIFMLIYCGLTLLRQSIRDTAKMIATQYPVFSLFRR